MPHREGYSEGFRPGFSSFSNIRTGAEVYGTDSRKIGEVDDIGPDYIHIKKGFLFTNDLCIPSSGVERVEDNKVFLNVSTDRIEQMGWTSCPTHAGYGTSTGFGTQEGSQYPTAEAGRERPGYASEQTGFGETRPGYQAQPTGLSYENIQRGWEVDCSDNKKLGNVDDITVDYIHVKKGFLFTKDLYIPKSAINYVEEGRVFLNVPCDQVESMNWNEPQGRGPSMGGPRLGM